jgi:hypothetical protein
MNVYSEDHPDLTRFALDELPTADSAALSDALAHQPTLQAEVTAIQELALQLRAQAPLHDLRLTPQQRQRVLQGPIAKPTATRPRPQHLVQAPQRGAWSLLSAVTRIAAMVALLLSTFWLGFSVKEWQAPVRLPDTEPAIEPSTALATVTDLAESSPSPSEPSVQEELATAPSVPPASTEAPPTLPPAPASTDSVAITEPAPLPPEVNMAAAEIAPLDAKSKPTLASSLGITEPSASVDFINASRRGSDTLALHPKRIRPPAPAASKHLQAKPLAPGSKPGPAAAPRGKPDLFVHAWRSEVASCPWNADHRLLRITVQLPSDQEAAQIGDHTYPLDITFDPNNVREFRRLCSRHYPSPEAGHAGKLVAWYEFQPNGSPAQSHGNGKHIANVRLAAAKFTTQAVGPFDATQVQVLDRGLRWQQAHEDFVFESAQVGLHLLMDGTPKIGQLNHQLVMQLAKHPQTADTDGSRAYFVQTLSEVQKLTGR